MANSKRIKSKEYKRINQKIKKQVNDFKFNQKFFSDDSVILQFGTGLTKPDIFSEAIVESGSLDNYQKLYRALVDSKKLSEKEFKEVTRNLVSSQFFKKFSVVADDVKTVVKGQPVTQVTNLYTFKTAEAREYLTRNKNVLQEILGENHYNDIKEILDIQALLTGADISKVSVTPLSNSLSLESLMSRFYSISRGIISPRYVATEIAIRRYNKNKGVLIKTVLENPNMAETVLKILQTQDPYLDTKTNKAFYNLIKIISI